MNYIYCMTFKFNEENRSLKKSLQIKRDKWEYRSTETKDA